MLITSVEVKKLYLQSGNAKDLLKATFKADRVGRHSQTQRSPHLSPGLQTYTAWRNEAALLVQMGEESDFFLPSMIWTR